MADKKKTERTAQEINFDNARELARVNHEAGVEQNTVGGYEGVEVRELKPVEVINPVRNGATGELQTDTRGIKVSDEEAVGATISDGEKSA